MQISWRVNRREQGGQSGGVWHGGRRRQRRGRGERSPPVCAVPGARAGPTRTLRSLSPSAKRLSLPLPLAFPVPRRGAPRAGGGGRPGRALAAGPGLGGEARRRGGGGGPGGATGPRALTHVPFAQVGGGLRGRGGLSVGAGGGGLPAGVRGGGHQGGRGGLVAGAGRRGFAVHFHVFSQGAGVGVGLVAASHFAVVGLVAGVDMRVLLPVAAVGEAPVTALEFTFERLLPCRRQWASTAISGGGGAGSSASLTPTAHSLPGPLSPALPRLLSPRISSH